MNLWELLLPRVQHSGSFILSPVNMMHSIVSGPIFEHFLFSHQLNNGLQSPSLLQVPGLIPFTSSDDKFFWPVHVFRGKAVASSRKFGSDIWGLNDENTINFKKSKKKLCTIRIIHVWNMARLIVLTHNLYCGAHFSILNKTRRNWVIIDNIFCTCAWDISLFFYNGFHG